MSHSDSEHITRGQKDMILLVHESPHCSEAIERLLREKGWVTVETTSRANEVATKVATGKYKAVLITQNPLEITGMKAATDTRSAERRSSRPHVLFFLLTSNKKVSRVIPHFDGVLHDPPTPEEVQLVLDSMKENQKV